MRIIDSALIL